MTTDTNTEAAKIRERSGEDLLTSLACYSAMDPFEMTASQIESSEMVREELLRRLAY